MHNQKLLILILFIIAFGVGLFGYTRSVQATTFADCPTTYGTLVCGEGEQYCGTCTTSIPDNRVPQWTLNCGTCSWSCPAPNVTCGNTCGPAYSGENPTCVTKKVTTDQCGNCTTTCRIAGDTYCSSTGTCLTPTACAGGSTWNGCACVANPYILASPSSPQSAYMNITGKGVFGDDIYMAPGKAIRMDGAGVSDLYFGNWAGLPGSDFKLHVGGSIYTNQEINSGGDINTPSSLNSFSVQTNYVNSNGNIALRMDYDQSSNPGDNFFNVRNGSNDLIFQMDEGGNLTVYDGINMNSKRINNLADPINIDDAATKGYVDSQAGGGGGYWVASGNNINSSNTGNVTVGDTFILGTQKFNINGNALVNGNLIFPLDKDATISVASLIGSGNGKSLTIAAANAGSSGNGGSLFLNSGLGSGGSNGNVVIANTGGNVGIGTSAPLGKIAVNKNMSDYSTAFTAPHVRLQAANVLDNTGFVGITYAASTNDNYGWSSGALRSDTGQSSFVWKYHNNTAVGTEYMRLDKTGNLGIGTTAPSQTLEINDNTGTTRLRITDTAENPEIQLQFGAGANDHWGIYNSGDSGNNLRFWQGSDRVVIAQNTDSQVSFGTSWNVGVDSSDSNKYKISTNAGGDVGIDTKLTLDTAGNGGVTGDWSVASITVTSGADLAEEFATSEDIETGTVVVLGDYNLGYKSVKPSYKSYDSAVVGVVSDNPSVIMGRIEAKNKAVVAMTGVVHIKVNNSNGIIKRGDLLTTSNTLGYAMKATNPQIGTVIGKAMEDLNSSSGQIMALINLQ
ncbi:hypothetical protein GW933_02880 [Candidatus Falkowbacteria bacterium]|uniref:Uncharacterized protein n=1 Tax=Candidatus Buchananbacteria bacterium CG10_big_fil_rev_8_21_14_0_10_33_19 TaxID=1974525 RepID=A0A2H0W4L9_9BACT|nr:hypothetical protein [Candidatus Falkowbacteria bacterium]PIS06254.1 MAG: hypothetical protein COT80_01635 [Candidatus Buchananbacteria bacterium CG10_big_fil_rev_8_21_14_0_10_33_19]